MIQGRILDTSIKASDLAPRSNCLLQVPPVALSLFNRTTATQSKLGYREIKEVNRKRPEACRFYEGAPVVYIPAE